MTITLNGTTGITTPGLTNEGPLVGTTVNGITVGKGAGSVATNTAVGANALAANTTGNDNTAVGYNALNVNTTGANNMAYGRGSLASNTTGSSNTAYGYQSLVSNTTGSYNTAVGYQASYSSNYTGGNAWGTSLGALAGYSQTTGQHNTLIGAYSGYGLTTGTGNTFVGNFFGAGCGSAVTTGSKNTIIGGYSGNQGGLDIRTASNYIVLSDGDGNPRAYSNGSGVWSFSGRIEIPSAEFVMGGGTTPSIYRTGANGSGLHFSSTSILPTSASGTVADNTNSFGTSNYRWTVIYATTGSINTSDREQKQDIQDLSASELAVSSEIKAMFKTFRWKDAVAKKGDDARIHVGVIAQDVQEAFAKHGLNATKYALWCSDTWYEVEGAAISDDGIPYTSETAGAIEKTRLGIRYDQLLAFVIAAL